MFSLQSIVLPIKLIEILQILEPYGVKITAKASNLLGDDWVISSIIMAIILVLGFNNTIEKSTRFRPTKLKAMALGVMFFYILISMKAESEFLYFNF